MKTSVRHAVPIIAIAVIGSIAHTALAATVQRTFVASTGSDTNACSLSAPCRGFVTAIAHTSAGGEVIVLDAAGYGPVTVSHSVSLTAAPGIYAGISVASGVGVNVQSPGANVVLRGLTITGVGGSTGIQFAQGARLRVENCVVSNLATAGIVQNAAASEMIVVDTVVRDNGGSGILVIADAAALLDHVRVEHNGGDGLYIVPSTSEVRAHITESVVAFNAGNGVRVDTIAPARTYVQIERSSMSSNGAAGFTATVATGARAVVSVTRSTFDRNVGDGIALVGSDSVTGFVVGILSENDVSINGGDGIGAHGSTDVAVNANTGYDNVGTGLRCYSASSAIRTRGNNTVSSEGSTGGCLFAATAT